MTAEILSVGTEILLGTIVNTNAAFIAGELAKLGIATYRQTTVGDNHERLMAAFAAAFENADMVITIGGLGPTQDDITKGTAAKYFGLGMETHEASLNRIKERFNGRPMPVNVERNALVTENSTIFPNDNGAAPGICIEKDGKTLMLFPGPPHELEPMFKDYAVPFLRKKTDGVFFSRTLKIIGIGESKVENMLQDLIDAQTNPTIAPYAKMGEVHIRLTASAQNETAAKNLIEPIAAEIYNRLSPNIYNEDDVTLPETVINLLRAQGHTIAIAESCTGGKIASDLVAVAGCSDVFREGLVTYSNEAKVTRLGVEEGTLKAHGAVSSQTAAAMAEGVAKTSGASIGLSTTGVAGPDGGTPEKPVGLVHIGLYINGQGTQTIAHNLLGRRNAIRANAAMHALDMLRRALE